MTGRHHRHQEPHQTLQLIEDELLKAPGECKISLQFSCLKWEQKIFAGVPEYLHVQ